MPGYAYSAVAFLSPAGHSAFSPHQSTSREGFREQLPIAARLRVTLHFQWCPERSRYMPHVPVVVDLNDSEESEF
jgi:hypothetical protein